LACFTFISQPFLCPPVMSVLLERLEEEGEVPLERYGHQVGGRQLFLKYHDCLCKPLVPRERFFYETAPAAVRRYIPQYFGKEGKNKFPRTVSASTCCCGFTCLSICVAYWCVCVCVCVFVGTRTLTKSLFLLASSSPSARMATAKECLSRPPE